MVYAYHGIPYLQPYPKSMPMLIPASILNTLSSSGPVPMPDHCPNPCIYLGPKLLMSLGRVEGGREAMRVEWWLGGSVARVGRR